MGGIVSRIVDICNISVTSTPLCGTDIIDMLLFQIEKHLIVLYIVDNVVRYYVISQVKSNSKLPASLSVQMHYGKRSCRIIKSDHDRVVISRATIHDIYTHIGQSSPTYKVASDNISMRVAFRLNSKLTPAYDFLYGLDIAKCDIIQLQYALVKLGMCHIKYRNDITVFHICNNRLQECIKLLLRSSMW